MYAFISHNKILKIQKDEKTMVNAYKPLHTKLKIEQHEAH
jgi:hypothetical protein